MDDLALDPAPSGGGGDAWMATFADMMTLLLCFFILLLSFATMDIVKFREAMGSVQEALGVQFEHDGQFEAVASSPLQLDEFEESGGLGEDHALLDELQSAIAEEGLDDQIGAEIDGRGVVVRINGRVLYRQGDAALRLEADAILSRIAALVRGTEHRVMIEGHTDDVPISTARYPSNWELSAARAIAGMRFLVEHGVDARRVGVAGYADQRPLEPNDGPEQRAMNRRVEFVFIRESDEESEPVPDELADLDEAEAGTEAGQTAAADAPPTTDLPVSEENLSGELDGGEPPSAAGL
jgi:chemotaxis protein MotB